MSDLSSSFESSYIVEQRNIKRNGDEFSNGEWLEVLGVLEGNDRTMLLDIFQPNILRNGNRGMTKVFKFL